jgi:hypothetical protein
MNKTRHTIHLTTLLVTTLIFATLLLSACSLGEATTVRGSGNVVEETREVSGVTGVNLATIGDLRY